MAVLTFHSKNVMTTFILIFFKGLNVNVLTFHTRIRKSFAELRKHYDYNYPWKTICTLKNLKEKNFRQILFYIKLSNYHGPNTKITMFGAGHLSSRYFGTIASAIV